MLYVSRSSRVARNAGFTLVELLVVLAILTLLVGLVGPRMLGQLGGAKSKTAGVQIADLEKSVELFKLGVGRFPSDEEGLEALVKKPTAGALPPNWRPYLDKLPADPWGRPYQFINPGVKGEIDIFSLGADGQAGGDGKNADIGSWQ